MAKSPSLEFFKSKSDVFLKDIVFQTGRSLMLCVKQEGRLEHRSSPSGITNHKLELFFCNEADSLGITDRKFCHRNWKLRCWNRESGKVKQSIIYRERCYLLFHQLIQFDQLSLACLEFFPAISIHLIKYFISWQTQLHLSWKMIEGLLTSLSLGNAKGERSRLKMKMRSCKTWKGGGHMGQSCVYVMNPGIYLNT